MITHDALVRALAKPGADILETLTPDRCELWHAASCVPSEAGELFDAIKKYVIYNKPLDMGNVIEELGDIEFYLAAIRQNLGIERATTLRANIDKLSKRYASMTYTDQAAQDRADKR